MTLPDEPDFRLTQQTEDEILDHTPLRFGKFRGKTPSHIAEKEVKGEDYLRWAYETVGNFPTCSAALYKDCGGRGKKAVADSSQVYRTTPSSGKDRAANDYEQQQRRVEGKMKTGFNDMDDDIPF